MKRSLSLNEVALLMSLAKVVLKTFEIMNKLRLFLSIKNIRIKPTSFVSRIGRSNVRVASADEDLRDGCLIGIQSCSPENPMEFSGKKVSNRQSHQDHHIFEFSRQFPTEIARQILHNLDSNLLGILFDEFNRFF